MVFSPPLLLPRCHSGFDIAHTVNVTVDWSATFLEPESAIVGVQLCVGHHDNDTVACVNGTSWQTVHPATATSAVVTVDVNDFDDGEHVSIVIRSINSVGLTSAIASSALMRVVQAPPVVVGELSFTCTACVPLAIPVTDASGVATELLLPQGDNTTGVVSALLSSLWFGGVFHPPANFSLPIPHIVVRVHTRARVRSSVVVVVDASVLCILLPFHASMTMSALYCPCAPAR